MLYYDRYAKSFSYEETEENKMIICYPGGRFAVDISLFFPCSTHDYKIFLGMIENSFEQGKHVEKLQAYFSEAIEHLQKLRDGENNATQKAKYNTHLKKWLAFYNELSKRFNLEAKEDAETAIKCKKTICYPFANWNNDFSPVPVEGWKFEKYGMQFYVYKNDHSKAWYTIMPFCGLACTSGERNKQAAIASITTELCNKIREELQKPGRIEELKNSYAAFLAKKDLQYILTDPLYDIPVLIQNEEQENTTPEASEDATTPETITSENYTEYAVKDRDGLVTPLQYNGNEGYVYAINFEDKEYICKVIEIDEKNGECIIEYNDSSLPFPARERVQFDILRKIKPGKGPEKQHFQTVKTTPETACDASGVKVYRDAIRSSRNGAQRLTGHKPPLLQSMQAIQAIQAIQPTGHTTPPRCNAAYYDSS